MTDFSSALFFQTVVTKRAHKVIQWTRVSLPSKPIPEGFKIWRLAESGYTYTGTIVQNSIAEA